MRAGTNAAALLAALALAGCPLPQPLPEVQRTGGQTVTPPRILVETALPAQSVVGVRPDCPGGTSIAFSATLEDLDLDDTVEARWFVDYDGAGNIDLADSSFPAAAPNGTDPLRVVPAFQFEPSRRASDGANHVVELVVSNGFYPVATKGLALPNRSPVPGYETQVFRWFLVPDASGRCQ